MKDITKLTIYFYSFLVFTVLILGLGILNNFYHDKAININCDNGMLIDTDTGHYCLSQNGYAQKVVFDCDGYLNNINCEMFEVNV